MTPAKIEWSGYECRGAISLDAKGGPFESAVAALCGSTPNAEHQDVGNADSVRAARSKGLVVEIPIYEKGNRSSSTYLFADNTEPDAGALLCLNNCGLTGENMRYGGWIGKSAWVDVTLRVLNAEGKLDGSYFYVSRGVGIPVNGQLTGNELKLNELSPEDDQSAQVTATMAGKVAGESITGSWFSKKTAKTYQFFWARRLY
ncbi:hypothetical protein D7S89_16625 [Trinickia fusca]|uniref:Uncharacterized protein n=2 Tax=Trinickia fusca TaxID=2419777 RepID=A0A494XBG8_9BURK|nr:hypothetical protein D7S89_16625 [Trinickia fusca]